MPKNLYICLNSQRYVGTWLYKLSFSCFIFLTCLSLPAQIIGNWNFNSTLTGTGSIFNTVSVADFSVAVPSRSFNAGVEYFGENGWPTGGINTLYYLEFTLTPNSGYALNLSSIILRLRHSNTGPSGGSGPTRFNLRSSLDGYTSDLFTGVLTGVYTNYTITPGAAFSNLPTAVTFRVYGHTAIVYSGGNNRFVFDNIQVDAIGLVLPINLTMFKANRIADKVLLQYQAKNISAGTTFNIERSTDGRNFQQINTYTSGVYKAVESKEFADNALPVEAPVLYYRLKTIAPDGNVILSNTTSVANSRKNIQLTVLYNRNQLAILGAPANAVQLVLYNASGSVLHKQSIVANDSQSLRCSMPHFSPGVYYVTVISRDETRSGTVFINH